MATYLAPSVPASLFEHLRDHLSVRLGQPIELWFDTERSGPRPGEPEPFSSGEADLAFICSTSYVWLTDAELASGPLVELVGAAWVPADARSGGHPRYFADVLATRGGPPALADLAGHRVAYNDEASLSGLYALHIALRRHGVDPGDVRLVRSGSHLASLALLADGTVDAAAIDSTVWHRRRRQEPRLAFRLTEIAQLGPHPVQPLVARRGTDPELIARIRETLLHADADPNVRAALDNTELSHFARIGDDDFAALRTDLASMTGLASE